VRPFLSFLSFFLSCFLSSFLPSFLPIDLLGLLCLSLFLCLLSCVCPVFVVDRELYAGGARLSPCHPLLILVRHDLPSNAASVLPAQMMMVPVQSNQGLAIGAPGSSNTMYR
jgi:hypothetical protein